MKEGDRERVIFLYERQIVADEEGFLGDILGRRTEKTDAKREIFRERRGKTEVWEGEEEGDFFHETRFL